MSQSGVKVAFIAMLRVLLVAGTGLATVSAGAADRTVADLVVTDARIYTAAGTEAAALASLGGRLVYVGDRDGVKAFIGDNTRVVHAKGRRILPGLVDTHIHPMDIVELDVCDLDSHPKSLRQLSAFVKGCIEHYKPAPGTRILVHQWNYANGNQPDAEFPSIRVALDRASSEHLVQLFGNDGHHAGFNSLALASATDVAGRKIGFSRETLAGEFKRYGKLVGVDANGEPNGAVNEDARYAINPNSMLYTELEATAKVAEQIPRRLNSVGITAMMDAMASPEGLGVYDALVERGQLTVWTNLAQFYDSTRFQRADGSVDFDSMVRKAEEVRARYASNPLIKADTVKLFADGVLEGNPFATPPTLPNGAMLEPLLQPIFTTDKAGHASVTGYVDTASADCTQVRAHPDAYLSTEVIASYLKAHGHHPAQCQISNGQLQYDRAIELEFVRRFHRAGFSVHIHAIGDRAVRTAVDAIEAARREDGNNLTRDGLAHVQIAHPQDIARIGRDHLYIAYTYAWANVDTDYDMTVLPFLQKVQGNGYASLHPVDGYYEQNAYPVRATKAAGAILTAGSDAPVETRDPRPFFNMSRALTRRAPGQPALNAGQAISIEEAIDAYTINGARALGRERDIGSLQVGKSADFVMLDRDPIAMAHAGHGDAVAATHVLGTWFQGREVYSAARGAH